MKKNKLNDHRGPFPLVKKGFLIMRLFLFLMILGVLQSTASVSQTKRFSLNEKNISVRDVLKQIENQSEFRFFYEEDKLNVDDKLTISTSNSTIQEVLDQLSKQTGIEYRMMENNFVVLKSKSSNESDSSIAVQQNKTISGKVTDSSGAPLPGVTVMIKGTTNGTITNADGKYTLPNVPGDANIVFSFVGMRPQEILSAGKTNIDVSLEEDAIGIEEVVAVGYGTMKKGNLTGAIASVGSEDLVKVSLNDVTNTMTGRAPGVRVVQYSSEPGRFDSDIDIRGFGTPLVIVDGVQRDKNGFDRLDPNEIESVSILKDASAAIYGVKAANGVVLVTTKKGTAGKMKVSYSGRTGVQIVTAFPEMCNSYQYATMFDEMFINNEISSRRDNGEPRYSAADIQGFKNGSLPSTDFLGLVMSNTANQQQHNVTLNGGTEKLKYFTSFGFFDEGGLLKSDALWAKKYNLRTNIKAEIAKGLNLGVNLGFINTVRNSSAGGPGWMNSYAWVLRSAMSMRPTEPVYANNNPDYLQQFEDGEDHPIALTNEEYSGYDKHQEKYITSTFDLEYKIPFVKGLSTKLMYAYDATIGFEKEFKKKYDQYIYDVNADTYTPRTHDSPSNLTEDYWEGIRKNVQFALNYDNHFGNHNVSGVVLYEQVERINVAHRAYTEYIIDAVDQLNAGSTSSNRVYSGTLSKTREASDPHVNGETSNQSFVGKVNYDYSGKYLAEFSCRYDGSSMFPKDSRWGFFPAASVGWRISEESFIKDNVPFLDNLKLRASYGKLGDDGAAAYQFLTGYTYPSGVYQVGDRWLSGLGFKNSANPDLTWYTSETSDIGLEGSLWNGRLSFEFDVFRRDRDGLLAYRNTTIPATYGVNLPQENLNSDRTQGFEIVFGHKNKIGDLIYSVSANMSYARTKNRYVELTPSGNSYEKWRSTRDTGEWDSADDHPVSLNRYNDIIMGYKTDGQFQSFDEIYASPIVDGAGNRTLLPGDIKYVDINKDNIIDAKDEVVIGRGGLKPAIYFGLNLSASWKNFDVSMLFQGATMYKVMYTDLLSRPFFWGRANPMNIFWDRWHREDVLDPNSNWIAGKYPSSGERQNYKMSDFWYRDGTYLRLKSLEIGYTLPKSLTQKVSIENCRIFANGYNLLTFTKGLDFIDPEYSAERYQVVDYSYPITMNINLGVQINF